MQATANFGVIKVKPTKTELKRLEQACNILDVAKQFGVADSEEAAFHVRAVMKRLNGEQGVDSGPDE